MAQMVTGAVVAKKFAQAYEESERLAAELELFHRENAMLRDEIDRIERKERERMAGLMQAGYKQGGAATRWRRPMTSAPPLRRFPTRSSPHLIRGSRPFGTGRTPRPSAPSPPPLRWRRKGFTLRQTSTTRTVSSAVSSIDSHARGRPVLPH